MQPPGLKSNKQAMAKAQSKYLSSNHQHEKHKKTSQKVIQVFVYKKFNWISQYKHKNQQYVAVRRISRQRGSTFGRARLNTSYPIIIENHQ